MPIGVYIRTEKHKNCGFQKGHPRFTNYTFPKGNIPWNKGKVLPQFSGKNHPAWKGGRVLSVYGYVLIYAPHHPNNFSNYYFEHRIVMEKHLGRYLNKKEVVHHINAIKTDNRLINLKLFKSSGEHLRETVTPWNKGIRTGIIPRTAFKKGMIPWNKGLRRKLL